MKNSELNFILRQLNMASEILIFWTERLSTLDLEKKKEKKLKKIVEKDYKEPKLIASGDGIQKGIDGYEPKNRESKPIGKFSKDMSKQNANQKWSDKDKEELRQMMATPENFSYADAQEYFGRSKLAIHTQMSILRKRNAEEKAS